MRAKTAAATQRNQPPNLTAIHAHMTAQIPPNSPMPKKIIHGFIAVNAWHLLTVFVIVKQRLATRGLTNHLLTNQNWDNA